MAIVLCEWMMCVHNASVTPQVAGECQCQAPVRLTAVDIQELAEDNDVIREELEALGVRGMVLMCANFAWSNRKEDESMEWAEEDDG